MPQRPLPPNRDLDISWRTRELGPEMRRELFRKAVPSVKLAAQPDDAHEQHAGADDQADRERPRRRAGAPAWNDEPSGGRARRGPDRSS